MQNSKKVVAIPNSIQALGQAHPLFAQGLSEAARLLRSGGDLKTLSDRIPPEVKQQFGQKVGQIVAALQGSADPTVEALKVATQAAPEALPVVREVHRHEEVTGAQALSALDIGVQRATIVGETTVAVEQEKTQQERVKAEAQHIFVPKPKNATEHYFRAAKEGELSEVKRVMLSGDKDHTDEYGETALHKAVRSDKASPEMIVYLCRYGPDRNVANTEDTSLAKRDIEATTLGRKTALHLAVIFRKPDIIQALLAEGDNVADLQAQDIDGNTPLHLACFQGDIDAARILLDAGSDINAVNSYGESPLHLAVLGNQPEMIAFLRGYETLEVNLQTNSSGSDRVSSGSKTALHIAAALEHEAAIDALLAEGPKKIEIEAVGAAGETALHVAAFAGKAKSIEALLSQGANIQAVNDDEHQTPLHDAACQGHLACVELLVEQRAEIEARNKDGETPLYEAVVKNHLQVIRYLCSQDAHINTQRDDGYTLFHQMAAHNQIRLLTTLLEKCDEYQDTFDQRGETALHKAAIYGNPGCVSLLVAYGANPNLKGTGETYAGYTPVRFAVSQSARTREAISTDHSRIFRTVATLMESGADISVPDERTDRETKSAFVTACHWGLIDTVRLMLTTEINEDQLKAGLVAARKNKQKQVIDLLIKTCVQLIEPQIRSLMGDNYIGPAEWEELFGESLSEVPAYPADIVATLESPCPFKRGQTVAQTHILFILPSQVKGRNLSILEWREIMNNKEHRSQYQDGKFYVQDWYDKEPFAKKSLSRAEWVLMPKEMVPNSTSKTYAEQEQEIAKYSGYKRIDSLRQVSGIMLYNLRVGTKLYGEDYKVNGSLPYVRCEDAASDGSRVGIGRFDADGFYVRYNFDDFRLDGVGAAVLRE
jgi:ankyrin repeat protein